MIWYRHWLEVRYVVIGAALATFGLGGFFTFLTDRPVSGELARSILAASFDEPALLAWQAYVGHVLSNAWMLAFCVSSTGLRSQFPPAVSPVFTLTLPVAGRRVIATRLAINAALSLALAAAWLFSVVLILAARGHQVPYGPLFKTFTVGAPIGVAWVAIMGALITFLPRFWSWIAAVGLLFATVIPVERLLKAWPVRGEIPGMELGVALALTALAVALILRYGPEQEFS